MTVMFNTETYPNGDPIAHKKVLVKLWASPAYSADVSYEAVGEVKTDAEGYWELALEPTDALVPTGQIYLAEIVFRGGTIQHRFTVPIVSASSEWIGDHLADPPGALETAALSAHILDPTAHGATHPDITVHDLMGLATDEDLVAETNARIAAIEAEEIARIAVDDALVVALDGKEPSIPPGTYVQNAIAMVTPDTITTLDLLTGNKQRITLDGDTTLAVENDDLVPVFFVVIETGAGGFDVTWWGGIIWMTDGEIAPSVTTTPLKRDVFAFMRLGPGDYLGSVVVQGLSMPDVPDVPSGLTATAMSASRIDLSWSATLHADTYSVERATSSGGTFTEIASGLTSPAYSDTSLSTGQHRWYRVKATNVVGTSPASATANATTFSVPGAPTGVAGTPGNATASIAFTPGATGGDPPSSYTATLSPGGATFTGASSPIIATGLTNGTAYTATVHATNSVGAGAESSASAPFTPTFSPADLTSLSVWYKEAASGSAGDQVSQWDDHSGNGRHLVQAISGRQPVLVAKDGRLVLSFDGVDDHFQAHGFTIPQPATMWIRFRQNADGLLFDDDGTTANRWFIYVHDGLFQAYAGGAIFPAMALGSWRTARVTFNGGSSEVVVDGVSTTGSLGTNSLTGLTVGASEGPATYAQVLIAELVIQAAAASPSEKSGMDSYLARWTA